MTSASEVCVATDWSGPLPALRVATEHSTGPARLRPLDRPLRFRAGRAGVRYCCGWFDLSGPRARHVVCEAWQAVSAGTQCERCRQREGFGHAHQAHHERAASRLPDIVRQYLAQPHRLYLGVFPDGSMKVGTVAEARVFSRLAEQGAVAACHVARAENGLDIRRLEAMVSARLGLRQAVSTRRKLHGLSLRVDVDALWARLLDLSSRLRPLLSEVVAAGGRVEPIDPPVRWQPPEISLSVFAATPVVGYPADLSDGEHSLYLRGITGSIALFTVVPDDGAQRYVASLAELYGVPIAFGEFESVVAAVQPSLF